MRWRTRLTTAAVALVSICPPSTRRFTTSLAICATKSRTRSIWRVFPLLEYKRLSLLAASIKCKEGHQSRNYEENPAAHRIENGSANQNQAFLHSPVFAGALTPPAASCTINWLRALSSAVRAFGLHPKGRPFKSDSAHQIFQQLTSRELQVIKPIVRVLSVFSPRRASGSNRHSAHA